MVRNLKLLRKKRGISQQKLADQIGVSQQSINKYENHNIEPDIDTLIRIADFFNTSVDYLIGHSNIERVIEPVETYDLNENESFLIDGFRKLTIQERDSIIMIIKNYNYKRI